MTPLEYAKNACDSLNSVKGEQWADAWFNMRREFIRAFTLPFIFSTRVGGADFFNLVVYHLENKKFLTAEKGEKLGEYDQNFNAWLRKTLDSTPA